MTGQSRFRSLFPERKSIIGMIALPPMPGYPEFTTLDAVVQRALQDLHSLQENGVHGVLIENDYDRPHRMTAGPEIVAAFTEVAKEVCRHARVPVGVEVLLNDWRASLDIAKTSGAQFVRLDFFVDRVRIQAGVIEPDPEAVLAYRDRIGAAGVALFTDIQVKHSELLEPGKSLATSAQQAIAHGSDALVVSGQVTGDSPLLRDLEEARGAAGDFPLLIGSGTTPDNAAGLLRVADGAIVGTSLKDSMGWQELVVPERVRALMAAVTK